MGLLNQTACILLALLALLAGAGQVVGAAQADHEAALVVDLGDGRVLVRVVSFAEETISGVELLQRSGLQVGLLVGWGGGAALCAVEDVGCPPTPQECFCQCQGGDCAYWSYFHLQGGQWIYATSGSGEHRLHDGDVDGWVWGDGTRPPPLLSWEEIRQLAQPAATAAAPPPPPATPPTATPTPTASRAPLPSPSGTPSPRETPVSRETAAPATRPAGGPTPSATPSEVPATAGLPTRAGQVPPSSVAATPTAPGPEQSPARSGPSPGSLLTFGGIVLLLVLMWLWVRRRRAGGVR